MWKPFFFALSLCIAWPGLPGPMGLASEQVQDERELRLERLFARLQQAPDAQAAAPVEATIKSIFSQHDSPTAELLLKQSDTAFSAGDFLQALNLLDVLTDQYPEFAEAFSRRATVLFLLGENERSLADLEQVLRLEPRHFGALGGMGLVQRAQGRLPEALAALRQALAIHPHMRGVQQLADEIAAQIEHSI